mgnify:FL=1
MNSESHKTMSQEKHNYVTMSYQSSDVETGEQNYYQQQATAVAEPKVLTQCDITERHVFIGKVFRIVLLQLLVTCGFIALFLFDTGVRDYFYAHPGLAWIAIIFSFVFLLMLVCCRQVAMSYPANYLILLGFTVCEGFLLGVISSVYDTSAVLLAGLITLAVTLTLIVFAMQTSYDFTGMGGYALCFLVVFVLAGFVRIFICKPGTCNTFEVVYAAIGALLFSFLMVYHTQLIVGGDSQYQFHNNDYVIAALSLYLDIINLFTFILRLVGGGGGQSR